MMFNLCTYTEVRHHDCIPPRQYYTFIMVSKGLLQQAEVAQGVLGSLRPRIFLMFWHYKGGRSSAIWTGRLYPRKNPWYSLSEAESTSWHMILSGEPRKKSPVTTLGIDPGTVRLVARCLNHYATPGPTKNIIILNYILFYIIRCRITYAATFTNILS